MYHVQRGEVLIVMLGGGDKATQATDIAKAVKLAAMLEDSTMTRKIKITDLPEFDMAVRVVGYSRLRIQVGTAAAVDMKNWLFSASTAMINCAREVCYFKNQMSLTLYALD